MYVPQAILVIIPISQRRNNAHFAPFDTGGYLNMLLRIIYKILPRGIPIARIIPTQPSISVYCGYAGSASQSKVGIM